MKRLGKDDVTAALARQRALPLFNCGDAATGMQVLEALHAGGIRFAAGVHCVGMGSHLVDAETLKAGRFAELTERTRRLVAILADVSPV